MGFSSVGCRTQWLDLLWCAHGPLVTSPACSSPCHHRRFCGWLPRRCVWLFGSCTSWVVHLWVLGSPHRRTLRRGSTLPHRRRWCGWQPRAIATRVGVGVSEFLVINLWRLGHLHTHASSMASPAISTSFVGLSSCFPAMLVACGSMCHRFFLFFPLFLPCSSGFSFVFRVCFVFWVCFLRFCVCSVFRV